MRQVDYIVVGAGSAGCAVAGRLADSARFRVLLIEAGPKDRNPWLHIPVGYGKSYYDPRVNWMYRTEPVPGLNDRVIYQPRGKVVGGSSAINAMVYARGQAADYDGWAALGNAGWGWSEVLGAYRRMEDHPFGPSDLHGTGGPVHVTDVSAAVHPLTRACVAAAAEAGLAFNQDLNGITQEGAGFYQITTKSGFRVSSARAFLWPVLKRGAIEVATDALVTRVLFEGRRAVGVEYQRDGRVNRVAVTREIILAAGAINSPQVLQLSGIGPAQLLQRHGVEVLLDSPEVGRNLQDHLCYDHVYRARRPTLNQELLPLAGKLRVGLQYLLQRKGPLSMSVNQGGGYFKTRPGVDRPDMQIYFSPLSYERAPPGVRAIMQPDPFPGFLLSLSPCRPTSRGHVAIVAADPRAAPAIFGNYLSTREDMAELVAGAHFLRTLAATPTLSEWIESETKPSPDCLSDADFEADIRARTYSIFHPCGTCRMGPDPTTAVVDPKLKVHGVKGLRVIDASIFPTIPSGNIGAPAMMVGMRGADFIMADAVS